ncbi:hypothetical protein ALC53_02319 [Atta colombica]|uniref:Uncharacterized protein n=1 Tax=Atta colombica TaxID=520822 RepID=A0A195BSZ7_9HYME|nr:hypothetical protein ALC53_02319 [Atta colombica]
MLKPSVDIIEKPRSKAFALSAWKATEIIRFCGYITTRSIVYDVVVKYTASKERTARIPAVVVRIQALISDDAEQSLRVLMDIVKPWMETVASRRHPVFQQDDASTHTSHSKLALRQRRYVLVQGILASQQSRFKSLGLLRMERS